MKKIFLLSMLTFVSSLSMSETKVPNWTVQPKEGVVKGDYYKIEERFRQGHLGTLEVVKNNGKLVHVEFNELTRPNYYNRFYQNVSKRLSPYNFSMAEKSGAAWIEGVLVAENQMIKEQRLTGTFDTVAGASNSIQQSMVPLAEKLNSQMDKKSDSKYYSVSENFGNGLTGVLKVIVEKGKIVECKYDEIFPDTKDEIKDKNLKEFYRQSKYWSIMYDEPSRIGFNVQMDALNDKVVKTQNLLDLTGLPATERSGNYKQSGFTRRNTAWDNYLKLAEKMKSELEKDKVLK
ncbi:FMN-binding protein [Candidatus Cetobacterium colombiensis]|uniref:FMN-binding protein n=1 Tax=Candidatus Cetobacterium colombiensis TaxID=3073100 RepID=A0ABU4WCV8_9FUSO|nr:FMN-binding protein [Candidatus Cetobacterium colombiensis]MDX8337368.1 FMN-binding protein [Candidatus Cetobacterium colombiensis]